MNLLLILGIILGALVVPPSECQQQCAATCTATTGTYGFLSADHSTDQYLYLAGIFGAHETGSGGLDCGAIRDMGIQNLEAFLWAVSTFHNRYVNALQGVSIGAIAFDSCGSSEKIIQQVMNLETCQLGYGSPAVVDPNRVLGFVGPDTSEQAEALAPLFHTQEKTLVSHAATSEDLNMAQYSKFVLRTVPSESEQINAIVAILNKFGWDYVQTVSTENSYGTSAMESFRTLSKASGICAVNNQVIPAGPTTTQMDDIIDSLLEKQDTKVVVVLADENIRDLLLAASRANTRGMFVWVGTGAWGQDPQVVQGVEDYAEGAITVTLDDTADGSADFTEYFRALDTSASDPWFEEYKDQFAVDSVDIDQYVPYTILAVDAILNGIEVARRDICGSGSSLCSSFMNSASKWAAIHDKIIKGDTPVTFNVTTGQTRSGKHAVINFRSPHGNCVDHCYVKVGSYDSLADDVDFVRSDVYFYDEAGDRVSEVSSECSSDPCTECGDAQIITTPGRTSATTISALPSQEKMSPPNRLREGTWVIVLIILAGIGILLVLLFEIYVLVKLWGTEIFNHWKSMWLGQLLLLAIFLCYLTLFAFVPSPTTASCGIIRFGVGGSYSMCFSVLLVKLMIILSSERVGNLQGTYQFFMFLFAWGVQIAVDIEWLILKKPGALEDNGTENGWVCNTHFDDHIKSLVYVMFLILICTLLSMKAHGSMANHRESIFIGLAAGFTIPVWLVWTLIGALKDDPEFYDPCLAFGLWVTATLLLFLMFLPKVRQLSRGVGGPYDDDLVDGVPSMIHGGSIIDPQGSVVLGSVPQGKPEPLILTPTHLNGAVDPESVILVPNGGVYTQPETTKSVPYQHDPTALYLKHPGSPTHKAGSVYSMPIGEVSQAPQTSIYATNPRVLHVTKDLTGRPSPAPNRRTQSELNYNVYYGPARGVARSVAAASSRSGTLKKARSIQDLGSL